MRVNPDVDLRVVTWDSSQTMSLGTGQIISNDLGNTQISERVFGNSITQTAMHRCLDLKLS